MRFHFKPVTNETWPDFERLIEGRGGPHNCWCMLWRKGLDGSRPRNKVEKKKAIHQYVKENVPIGLLAYHDDRPMAWCSIAPRETYRNLGGDETKEKVWSLACFFIHREYRHRGLTCTLLQEAIKMAKNNGARFIEAYPVDPKSPSYRFMGVKPVFEKLGFSFVKMAGSRRNVMIKKVS